MARGDGIHRTNARNMRLTAAKIGNVQLHNEREKESYVGFAGRPLPAKRAAGLFLPPGILGISDRLLSFYVRAAVYAGDRSAFLRKFLVLRQVNFAVDFAALHKLIVSADI